MALDFYPILDQLTNPTNDLGGGPRPDDAKALAQLILQGGGASAGGNTLFGSPPTNDTARELQLGPGNLFPGGVPSPGARPLVLPVDQAPRAEVTSRTPLRPGLEEMLQSADQIATSLGGGSGKPVTKALVANPYGPGSYDPNDPAAVAEVKAQGKKVADTERARQLIQDIALNPAFKGSQGELVKGVLESLGVVKSDAQKAKEIAQAKAEGERAGGKGPVTIPPSLMKAVGTKDFDAEFNKALAAGAIPDPSVQLRLEKANADQLKAATVGDIDRRGLTDLRGSHKLLGELQSAYDETPAAKTGKISDTLKLALAQNTKAASALEAGMLPLDKLEPSERKFAAKYNSFLLGLRRLSGDPRFSDQDAQKALIALGNPAVGRDLYKEQLGALQADLGTRYTTAVEDLKNVGRKDTSGFPSLGTQPAPQGSPQVGAVVKGYAFKGGDPSKKENWVKQ